MIGSGGGLWGCVLRGGAKGRPRPRQRLSSPQGARGREEVKGTRMGAGVLGRRGTGSERRSAGPF